MKISDYSHWHLSIWKRVPLLPFIHLTNSVKMAVISVCEQHAALIYPSLVSWIKSWGLTPPLCLLSSVMSSHSLFRKGTRESGRGVKKVEEWSDLNTERERKRIWCHTDAMCIYEQKRKTLIKTAQQSVWSYPTVVQVGEAWSATEWNNKDQVHSRFCYRSVICLWVTS